MDNPYYEKLVNAALRFVSYRPRSKKELTDFLTRKLRRWHVSGSVLISRVVARMGELGYVNDLAFARWWKDQRTTFKPKGSRLIALELTRKGISKRIISIVLDKSNESEGQDELSGAKRAIAKKLILWAKLPTIAQKRKAYTFLSTRGFSSDTIKKIIDEISKKDYN